jgi:hypothetical protein
MSRCLVSRVAHFKGPVTDRRYRDSNLGHPMEDHGCKKTVELIGVHLAVKYLILVLT